MSPTVYCPERADPGRHEVDDGNAQEGPCRLPDGAPPGVGGVLGAGDEGARADPRAHQGEHHLAATACARPP